MNVPKELRYHPEHTWARLEDGVATVGITDHAQKELGDIVFLELPEEGRELSEGEVFGTVESSKSVSELYCPVGGQVEAVNRGVEDAPERINDDPYGGGWLIRVRLSPGFDPSRLLDAAAYEEHVGES